MQPVHRTMNQRDRSTLLLLSLLWGGSFFLTSAAILSATTLLFTVLVAHFLLSDERLTANRLAGVIVGFCGVAVTIGPGALAPAGGGFWAQLAVLGAALSYAFAGVFGRRFRRMGVAAPVTAAGQVTASTALLLPVALLVDRPWTLAFPSWPAWGAVLGIAALSTALAYLLYFRLLGRAGATNLALVTFLIPVTAILLGALVLSERPAPRHFYGMALIGLSLAITDGRLLHRAGKVRPASPSP